MSEKEAIEVLVKFNEWRRFDGDIKNSPEMPELKTIGKAIDTVIFEYEKKIKEMSEFKGTQGEWEVATKSTTLDVGYDIIWSENDDLVAEHVYKLEDAKLIAAAPELLKALQIYLNAGGKEARREASVIAKKAISKALD